MELNPDAVWACSDQVSAHPLGSELLLLDGKGEMLRGINSTGRRVWELLDGRRSASSVAELLATELGMSVQDILPEVVAFLAELEGRGLLLRVDRRPPRP